MGWHGSYKERKYEVGQRLLMLRTRAKLTQAELAALVGVTRRSIQNWETSAAYPKEEPLQRLLAVLLARGVFSAGQEREEAVALWELVSRDGSHRLALFDEAWFAGLLTPPLHPRPEAHPESTRPWARVSPSHPLLDWDEAMDVPVLYGRDEELATLQQWVLADHCRVVALLGLGGIGKSSLAVTFARQAAGAFDAVCFRSLRNAPRLGGVLDGLIRTVSTQQATPPEPVADKITLLLQHLREQRCLLVLDNLETILQPGANTGDYLADYTDYGALIQRLGEVAHQSCLLLTSREKPVELGPLEGRSAPVRTLTLAGLAENACQTILQEKEVYGADADCAALAHLYGGNPLALKLVSEPIRQLFGGAIHAFLAAGDAFFNGVGKLLEQQFERSTPLEQVVLYWLAITRELAPLATLRTDLAGSAAQRDLLVALESLRRRLLIERGANQPGFTLQPVIMEYVTDRLVTQVSREIVDGQPALLHSHALVQATVKDYVRHTQERLIATPLLEQLVATRGGAARVEQLLIEQLQRWRGRPVAEQGYGPGNVVNLLRLLRGHLRGLDLAHLAIRQAHLQGVEMQDANLAGAAIHDSVFIETFDALTALAVSRDEKYWAAASRRGEIRVWTSQGLILHRAWQAHTIVVYHLAFSPDGRTLASGSWGGVLKLWDVESSSLLWSGRHAGHIHSVAFSPDGAVVASSGDDATIRLWDRHSGKEQQILPHPGPVSGAGVPWSPDGALLVSGDEEGTIRLWEVKPGPEGALAAACVQTVTAHTRWVDGLAFSPDGSLLASGSFDGTVKVWQGDPPGRESPRQIRPWQTLSGHTDCVTRVVWSPDGRFLASSSFDQTIRLWDVEACSYRAVLQGHHGSVGGIGFTPDGGNLVSGSEDGTLRLWDSASGECLRVMQGYAASLYKIDWSPDSAQLVSGGSDGVVALWDVRGGAAPRLLHGHSGAVLAVGWSPGGAPPGHPPLGAPLGADSRWVASAEWGNVIRLWDAATGANLHKLQHADDAGNFFDGLAWSPDGRRLASGSYRHGVQLFERMAGGGWSQARWPGPPSTEWIRLVAWSPDGAHLAGGSDDGTLYILNPDDGRVLQQWTGHHSTIMALSWSPQGSRIASGGRGGPEGPSGGELLVWDVQRGESLHLFADPSRMVSAVAWGPEGAPSDELLISGGSDGCLRWWDVQRGECVRERTAHQGTVQSLKRSPDGTMLASCGDDGAIMLWDLHSGEHLQTLRRDRPYERMDITGVTGLTTAQVASLKALGAVQKLTG
jgi:WD40 repeat protein/transcriptional regulator with XRE-family HTH domain